MKRNANTAHQTVTLVTVEQAMREERERMATKAFTVYFNGHHIPFETLNEASGIICELRDQSGLGARELGAMFPIVDEANKEVGFVSYNGEVFEGTRANWQSAKQVYPDGAACGALANI